MASSSSLTLSQAILARAISHHGSNSSSNSLSLTTLTIPTFSGLKSSSLSSSSSSKHSRLSRRRLNLSGRVRATAVETLDKTIDTSLVEKSINTIRFLAIDAVEKANSGHPGLPIGCAPMGHILYDEVMRYNPKNPVGFN